VVAVPSGVGGTSASRARALGVALRKLECTPAIDLLFTDIGLPGMNGRQLGERHRSSWPPRSGRAIDHQAIQLCQLGCARARRSRQAMKHGAGNACRLFGQPVLKNNEGRSRTGNDIRGSVVLGLTLEPSFERTPHFAGAGAVGVEI
jgi:hypothetical protein